MEATPVQESAYDKINRGLAAQSRSTVQIPPMPVSLSGTVFEEEYNAALEKFVAALKGGDWENAWNQAYYIAATIAKAQA